MRLLLPSPDALLRVAGRGRGWGRLGRLDRREYAETPPTPDPSPPSAFRQAASADGWEGRRVHPARHCEEPLRRSNPESRCGEILDCFACARNDGARVYDLATPGARGLQEILSRLQKKEGAGNAGCSMHPQPRVQIKKDARALTRFTGITPAFPAQWC